jgi:hypothetical protein
MIGTFVRLGPRSGTPAMFTSASPWMSRLTGER